MRDKYDHSWVKMVLVLLPFRGRAVGMKVGGQE